MIWYPPINQTVDIPDEDKLNCAKETTTERANSLVPAHGYYVIDQSSDLVDASNVPSKYPPTVPVFLVIRDTSCLKFVDIMRNEPNISLLVECGGTLSSFLERVNRNYITRDECYAQLSEYYSAQFKQELNRFFI